MCRYRPLLLVVAIAAAAFTFTNQASAQGLERYNGYAFIDANRNGVRDAGEVPGPVAFDIGVVYVGPDGVPFNADDSLRTYIGPDASGRFTTEYASAGEGFYFIIYRNAQPAGYTPTIKDAGGNAMTDSDLYALPNGAWVTDVFIWDGNTPVADIGIGLQQAAPVVYTNFAYLPLVRR